MLGSTSNIMRTIFLILIFQLIAPAFLPVAQSFETEHEKPTSIQTHHSSILLPLLEREENEHEESLSHFTLTQLIIDFTDHTFALAVLHEFTHNSVQFDIRYNHQLPLFNMFCAFLI
jgi:hypothetical protein